MEMEFTYIQMETSSEESLNKELKKVMVSTYIDQELTMMAIGNMIKRMVKEHMFTQTNKYTQEDGLTIKNMVMESTNTLMEINMLVIGSKTRKMEKVL